METLVKVMSRVGIARNQYDIASLRGKYRVGCFVALTHAQLVELQLLSILHSLNAEIAIHADGSITLVSITMASGTPRIIARIAN